MKSNKFLCALVFVFTIQSMVKNEIKVIKTTLVWVVLLFSTQVFSQSGTVKYNNEAEMSYYYSNLKQNYPEKFKKIQHFATYEKKMLNQINYKLVFSEHKSIFKPIVKNNEEKMILTTQKEGGVYYKDSVSNYFNTIRRSETFDVQLAEIKWEITSDSKEILGYKCFKAIGNKIDIDSSESTSKIEAWFTEEINLSHGPMGINGLPGLVLEAHFDHYHFYATEIKFESHKEISKPIEGKSIDENQYIKLLNK